MEHSFYRTAPVPLGPHHYQQRQGQPHGGQLGHHHQHEPSHPSGPQSQQHHAYNTSSSNGSTGSGAQQGPNSASLEKKRETRRRTKTGCLTCRKRRIKCDEGKPECLRCIKSKRVCEGYSAKTVFRNENQMHYQQTIRPSPGTQTNGYPNPSQPIQFSVPQYQASSGEHTYDGNAYAAPSFVSNGHYPHTSQHGGKLTVEAASRNSSASNASGVSANSEQRRISVLSLMSSDKVGPQSTNDSEASKAATQSGPPIRTPELDARDNYYYNYYVSAHAYTLARCVPTQRMPETSSPDHPGVLWPQVVPSLINEDPSGRRSLFDAVIAYTAHIRFEEIPVDYEIRSTGAQASLIELGLKAYIDIIRGTSETIARVETFFKGDDYLRLIFRWGLLQHTITSILADTKPRVAWVNFLGTKAFGSDAYQSHSEAESFYVAALRHISSGSQRIPPHLLELQGRYDFLSIPGMDLVYFAFIQDFDALRNIVYHILSNPRLEFLYTASRMVNGGRLRGEPDLDILANDLMVVSRQIP